ncbi:hypothetical protein MRX96_046263 [Rhipicephalus microplus]
MQKYLWWKRYLTELQIVQFVGLMLHMAITLVLRLRVPQVPHNAGPAARLSGTGTLHQLLHQELQGAEETPRKRR